jgi:hypothetical protein
MIRDLRKYSGQTNFRLLVGGILLLIIVGDGLIWLIFGASAAAGGIVCILLGLAPLLLVWVLLSILEFVVKRANRDE